MTDPSIDNSVPSTYTENDTGQAAPANLENLTRSDKRSDIGKEETMPNVLSTIMRPSAPTLRDFVEHTYRSSFIEGLELTTQDSYTRYLDRYIYPFLGRIPINQITVVDIQNLYDWLANGSENGFQTNIVSRTIDRVGGLLGRILKVAEALHVIRESPYKPVLLRNHGSPSRHHKAVSDAEVSRIRAAVPLLEDRRERLYAALLVYTGMRREEILGLRWEDIHLDEGYGSITRVIVYPGNGCAVIKDHPKTASSERIFIITDELADILRPTMLPSGFVISGRRPDLPASISTFKRTSKAVFQKLRMTGYNNHDWRATFATQLKESGMTSAQVADLLGHADTRMVETIYATARKEGILKYKNTVNTVLSCKKHPVNE